MDEVIEQFQTALSETSSGAAGNQNTTFDGLYKNWGRLGNQEERRKELLEIQKSNRNQKLDKFRGILELVNAVEENVQWEKNTQYRVPHYRPSIYVAGFNKASQTYRDVLMLSEWMIEKPADFHENWYVVPCPKGVRMLVVANEGSTKCYTKYGQFRFNCSTSIPGGHRTGNPKEKHQCCVLDCFYIEKTNTMFVVDLLAWNNTPMTDGETEFRHFWLTSKFTEIPSLTNITKQNKMIFKLLPKVSCDPESFQSYMLNYPPFDDNFPPLDGLLFYHKRAHYVSGETPLVGWLYPYMVPEVLGADIKINTNYVETKPLDYVNQADFIQKFEEKNSKKSKPGRPRRMSTSSSCETEVKTKADKSKSKNNSDKMDAEVATATSEDTDKENKTQDCMEAEITDSNKANKTESMESEETKEVRENMDETRPKDERSSEP